jgi:hypothetical protein
MSQGSGATGPASVPLEPELPEPPLELEPPLEPELPLDAVPDEVPLELELLWVPELEPLPDAGASPDPPSSPADVVLPDELPGPLESPCEDEDSQAAIHGGALASPRIAEQVRQFIDGDLTVGEALVAAQGVVFRSANAASRPAALTIAWASAGKVIPLKLTLPVTAFPGPPRLALALVVPTQLFV